MSKTSDFIYADTEKIESYSREEFDVLRFGAIKLDKEGVILKYNAYEGRLAGRDPGEVVGKNFFTEVAPCTNVQEFGGRFREGVESGKLYATLPFRFLFPGNSIRCGKHNAVRQRWPECLDLRQGEGCIEISAAYSFTKRRTVETKLSWIKALRRQMQAVDRSESASVMSVVRCAMRGD
ncbi:MAG: hypothetical protein AABO41_13165 [Acidobacteriota bacterium]